jgi:hypothetical protein
MNAWEADSAAALDHVRTWLRHWGATSGIDHDDARIQLRAAISYWRRFHKAPADARYVDVVQRSKRPTAEAA